MVHALALDIGSSQIKIGILNEEDHVEVQHHEPSPNLKGRGGIRITNPALYLEKTTHLLGMGSAPKETPIGIACQRSSFLLWHARSGKTLTPLISWQDLRAESWCQENKALEEEVRALTGLPLSPHYVASKLAFLFKDEPRLLQMSQRGLVRFGTLETYLLWNLSQGGMHVTDISMAARTQLLALTDEDWSPRLLDLFGIPRQMLPDIAKGPLGVMTMNGRRINATIADQAACAMPVLTADEGTCFINAGTATFLMRKAEGDLPKGVLASRLPSISEGASQVIWEAPINAGARTLRGFRLPSDILRDSHDPTPDAFAIADSAGLGAPHWRADLSNRLSPAALEMGYQERQRIVFESLIFRTKEVIEHLFPNQPPSQVIISGGLSARFDFTTILASVLDVPLYTLKEKEMTLFGAGWLASAAEGVHEFAKKRVKPKFPDSYLQQKYHRWKTWLQEQLT